MNIISKFIYHDEVDDDDLFYRRIRDFNNDRM